MEVSGRGSRRFKSAHQIMGRWQWIGGRGELRSYLSLPHLIADAGREGWQFDHRVGSVGIFCGDGSPGGDGANGRPG